MEKTLAFGIVALMILMAILTVLPAAATEIEYEGQKYEVSKSHMINVPAPLLLPPVPPPGSWYFGDLHVHTNHSDCDPNARAPPYATVQYRYEEASALGLDWISVTDHSYCFGETGDNAVEEWNNMKSECDAIMAQHPDFIILPSEELSVGEDCPVGSDDEICEENPDLCRGNAAHLGAHNLSTFIANAESPCPVGTTLRCPSSPGSQEGINLVNTQGGISIIYHPCRSAHDWESINCTNGETGIEIWNGENPNSSAIGLWIQELLRGHRVYCFGGSDTETGALGEKWVFNAVYIPKTFDRYNLTMALKHGNSYVSNGPALVLYANPSLSKFLSYEKVLMGDAILVKSRENVTLEVYYNLSGSGTIWIHKGIIGDESEDIESDWPKSYSKKDTGYIEIEDKAIPMSYYRAEFVSGSFMAYTNPIWIEEKPTIGIYTDKYIYTKGNIMHIGLNVKNHGDALPVWFAIWLEKVGGGSRVVTYQRVMLPAGLDYHNPNFMVFTLPNLPTGWYVWHAALMETTEPVVFISHDTALWYFVPTSKEASTKDIERMLEQAIVIVDFEE